MRTSFETFHSPRRFECVGTCVVREQESLGSVKLGMLQPGEEVFVGASVPSMPH